MKCANCSGEHAANWSRCPANTQIIPNGKNKNGPKPKKPPKIIIIKKSTPQAVRPDISKARKSRLIWTNLNRCGSSRVSTPRSQTIVYLKTTNRIPHTVTRGVTAIYCVAEIVHNRVPLPAMQGIDATAVQIKIKNSPPINIVSKYVRIKAEVIADSLQEQFEPNHVAGREDFDQRIHAEVENFLATPHVQEIEPTTPTEVLTYLQRIKPKKSTGLDQISNRPVFMCFDFFPDLSNESVNFAFVWLISGVVPEFTESILALISSRMFSGRRR
ncbi:hypothetical protein TNCV_4314201 [Trichonephila clavipes]|nr:hypothetical protein TNCV_4314201 [Trichonephila clavipes]